MELHLRYTDTDYLKETVALISTDGRETIVLENEAGSNGYDQEPGPLTWLNSAAITIDPEDDAVHVSISVGDPRGAFQMTLRRLPDGRIVLHHPYAGEPMPHVETKNLHEGTLELKGNYADEGVEPDDEDEDEQSAQAGA